MKEKIKAKLFGKDNRKSLIIIVCVVAFIIILAVTIITVVSVKNKNKNALTAVNETLTSGVSDVTDTTVATTVLEETLHSSNETTSSVNPYDKNKTTVNSVCAHTFKEVFTPATCTSHGSIVYTCTKCGYSYVKKDIAPGHEYVDYLCRFCGKPSPTDPVKSLGIWLRKNGDLFGNEIYRSIDSGNYSIATPATYQDADWLLFDCVEGDEIFRISMCNEEYCDVNYSKEHINVAVKMKMSDVGRVTITKFDDYYNQSEVSEQELLNIMNTRLQPFLREIESRVLNPRTGLTFRDFGITAY